MKIEPLGRFLEFKRVGKFGFCGEQNKDCINYQFTVNVWLKSGLPHFKWEFYHYHLLSLANGMNFILKYFYFCGLIRSNQNGPLRVFHFAWFLENDRIFGSFYLPHATSNWRSWATGKAIVSYRKGNLRMIAFNRNILT